MAIFRGEPGVIECKRGRQKSRSHPGERFDRQMQYTQGGAENDGHEIAGHEIDGPSCRA